jgi:hypothetical protein
MRFGATTKATDPSASISALSALGSRVGEWMNSRPSASRTTLMRVGNGILSPAGPNPITGPSTIHTFSATGFSVSSGG